MHYFYVTGTRQYDRSPDKKSLIMNYEQIISKYYKDNPELLSILMTHSRAVARKALAIADAHPELGLDRKFIMEAAMVHDIGVVRTDAPDIKCFGTEPYIRHGVLGAEIMRAEGYPRHARVCERHTGAGLSLKEIEEQNLPLPHVDLLPETLDSVIDSQTERDSQARNAYATIKELNAFMMKGSGFIDLDEDLKQFSDLHVNVSIAGSDKQKSLSLLPMDFCFLMDGQDAEDSTMISIGQYIEQAAQALYEPACKNKRNQCENHRFRSSHGEIMALEGRQVELQGEDPCRIPRPALRKRVY